MHVFIPDSSIKLNRLNQLNQLNQSFSEIIQFAAALSCMMTVGLVQVKMIMII